MLQMDFLVSLLTAFLLLQQLFIIRFAFVSWNLFADAKPKILRSQHCCIKKSKSLKEILVYPLGYRIKFHLPFNNINPQATYFVYIWSS